MKNSRSASQRARSLSSSSSNKLGQSTGLDSEGASASVREADEVDEADESDEGDRD